MDCSAFTVIVTVAGLLLVKPSFTINCATYVPTASATNTGDVLVADSKATLLPAAGS